MHFLSIPAARAGAVLPILHLNGYKISGPTVLGRASDHDIRNLLRGHGYEPIFVQGDEPMRVHGALAAALDESFDRIREIQAAARSKRGQQAVRWPAIILRTPKGWTGPKALDGVPIEGTFRSHQVPLGAVRTDPRQLAMLESWMQSYRPRRALRPRRASDRAPDCTGASARAPDGRRTPTRTAGKIPPPSRCPTSSSTRSTSQDQE